MTKSAHPYSGRPAYTNWKRSVSGFGLEVIDPAERFSLAINRGDALVTAGSCFAQHISRYLRRSGFNYLVTEPSHPVLDPITAKELNYNVFSARYGNIYTARQLWQLYQRAYDDVQPLEDFWPSPSGTFVDPFRPQIQPGGFVTLDELRRDRRQHLGAVRQAFEQLNIFIFTLGLTETWQNKEDGFAYPLAPGVVAGTYDPERYIFVNQSVTDVITDMDDFLTGLRRRNKTARVILTVSPVPLMATAEDRHVVVSTVYSKAVLRVAAEELVRRHDYVHYFPSFEIVAGPQAGGSYFGTDKRQVLEQGVRRVMEVFMSHACGTFPHAAGPEVKARNEITSATEELVKVLCDEELLGAT